ncbi:hypothetical protein [Undibacterium sp. YM2]|uniref:hypothetical protein n=1 Tax=Undibacterium sp. YM2 TaxID=2058625 RepID=UPI0013895AB0|nr:hypothetical protein [Undibacterium sp. YM2]
MIRLKSLNFMLALMVMCPGYAFSLESAIKDKEQLLIGTWQKGLTAEIAALSADKLALYKSSSPLGEVVQYKADHSFVMYPPCGKKAEDLRKLGLSFIEGTWQINDAGDLVSEVSNKGKVFTQVSKIDWINEQLVLTIGKPGTGDRMGKYSGKFPPQCS